jgi:predicted AAA+ superfamily ATPase
LKQLLQDHPVVILHGARQTGKTTLAMIPSIARDRAYLTLDDLDTVENGPGS